MSNSPQLSESSGSSAERRSWPRRIPDTLTYIHLGTGNGGIVLNVSEGGLRLASAGLLSGDANPPMCLRLPGTREWIETPGQIVWTSKSRKEAGVRFVGLAESDRDRIKNWMALDASRIQLDKDARKVPEPRSEPSNTPKTIEPKAQEPAPAVVENSVPDQKKVSDQNAVPATPLPPVSPVSTPDPPRYTVREPIFSFAVPIEESSRREEPPLVKDASPIEGRSPIQEEPADTELQTWQYPANRRTIIKGQVGLWLAAISLVSLISIISFVLGMTAGRGVWDDILGIVGTGKTTSEQENRSAPASSPNSATSAPVPLLENMPLPLPEIARGPFLEIPAPPLRQITKPPSYVIPPAPRAQAATISPSPIPERMNTVPAPATEVERVPPPQVKPPESPRPEPTANSSPAPKPAENVASPTGSIEIIPDLYLTIRTPSESTALAPRSGASLRIGHLVSRAEPVYPAEALRQRIAGTVKLHALIARDGTVQRVELLDGPAYLTESARAAVQQWIYEPTLLGGESVETEEDISIVFRIANSTPTAN
jgi:TonB family protein